MVSDLLFSTTIMIFEIIGLNSLVYAAIWATFLFYCVQLCIRPKNFPNGPMILPFFGSAWTIPAKGLEFSIPNWVKKYGKTIGHKFYYEKMVIFCDNEDIQDGLKHPNFQGRYQSKSFLQRTHNKPLGFFLSDDETWSEARRITLRYFGTVFNTKLETILQDELLEEFNAIRTGEIINIDGSFMNAPLNLMLRILSSTHRKDNQREIDDMQAKIEQAFAKGRMNGIELVYPIFRRLFKNDIQMDAIIATQKFLKEKLEEHKQNFDELDIKDYTDAFINESKKEFELNGKIIHFTDEEYMSCGIDMVQAGNESTDKATRFVLLYIALNQRVQDEIHKEIDRVVGQNRYPTLNDRISMPYLESTIYEAMRINPVGPNGGLHRVTDDTNFKGYFLEKGTMLCFALKYAMNDPKKWQNPDEFMPERFMGNDRLRKELPSFGLGKRSCIGEGMAKNFMFLYLAYFFQRFSIRLPSGYTPSTYPVIGFTNGPKPFKLIISDRRNTNK